MLLIQDCSKQPLYNTLSEEDLDLRSKISSFFPTYSELKI